jgi:hypothetical protein
MKRAVGFLLVGALGATACARPGPHTREGGAVSPLAVFAVDWNPAHAPTGAVRAVVDEGDVVSVFSQDGATVLTSGALQAHETRTPGYVDGAVLPGVDGGKDWVVGITEAGHVYHLRGATSFEDVTPRYGLGSAHVRSATTLGPGLAALLLANEVATADGARVRRWPAPGLRDLAGGGGLAAGTLEGAVDVFDFAHGATWRFLLPGVKHVAVDGSRHLYASTERGLYVADDAHRLTLVFDAGDARLGDLAASGDNVWFVDGDELAVVDRGRVEETKGAHVAHDAKLSASPTGDVWVISQGSLARFVRARTASVAASWQHDVAPVFSRACAACHLPSGVSGVDLSSFDAWVGKRKEIVARVLEERSMPPRGHPLSDADRAVIERWVGPR